MFFTRVDPTLGTGPISTYRMIHVYDDSLVMLTMNDTGNLNLITPVKYFL